MVSLPLQINNHVSIIKQQIVIIPEHFVFITKIARIISTPLALSLSLSFYVAFCRPEPGIGQSLGAVEWILITSWLWTETWMKSTATELDKECEITLNLSTIFFVASSQINGKSCLRKISSPDTAEKYATYQKWRIISPVCSSGRFYYHAVRAS